MRTGPTPSSHDAWPTTVYRAWRAVRPCRTWSAIMAETIGAAKDVPSQYA
jgi:hypothetical protein